MRIVRAVAKDRRQHISICLGVIFHCNRHAEPSLREIGFGQLGRDKRRVIIMEHDNLWLVLVKIFRGQAAVVRDELVIQTPGINRVPAE